MVASLIIGIIFLVLARRTQIINSIYFIANRIVEKVIRFLFTQGSKMPNATSQSQILQHSQI